MRWLLVMFLAGCGGTASPCVPSFGNARTYEVDALTLPLQRTDFAIDLNGDGRLENQLGNIIGAVTTFGIDAQGEVDRAFRAGEDPMQVRLFDGAAVVGELLPDHTQGTFCLRDGESDDAAPVALTMTLPYFDNVTVHVTAAHLAVAVTDDIVRARLNGAISIEEVQALVIPAIARLVNRKITGDPGAMMSQQLLSLLDNGGTAPPGECGGEGDGTVSVCEVANNGVVKNIFAPDVDLFDASGAYLPARDNAGKDSLSIGVQLRGHLVTTN